MVCIVSVGFEAILSTVVPEFVLKATRYRV
jgi:hypothetical protein